MDIKKGLIGAGAVLVAGVIIAGQTLGWRTFLPSFSSAQINISPTSRAPCQEFFANEKLWITLSDAETDRVYWVFDESNIVIPGGVQLQYAFPFDATAPIGEGSRRRIDAFYKVGDGYRHVATRVSIINIQIKAATSFGPHGLALTLPTKLAGEWKLGTVGLAKLSKGEFLNVAIEPESSTETDADARIVWNGTRVASEFGYTSIEEAGLRLMSDKTVWVSAEYKGHSTGETLIVVKSVGVENKP